VVTYEIKHLTAFYVREVDGSETFLQMFYFTCKHGPSLQFVKQQHNTR